MQREDADIDLREQLTTISIIAEGAYIRARGKSDRHKPISASELITELTIIRSCADYAMQCVKYIAQEDGDDARVLI